MKKVLIPIANGFEEIEAVSLIDVLRRAGISVVVAGVNESSVKGANEITIQTDILISEVSVTEFDMVVLPGGWGGTDILASDEKVQTILKEMNSQKKPIGAICAAPYALDVAGVLKDNFTCYPSAEEKISKTGYSFDKMVVRDGNIITSRGPGTSICFGLQIVKDLVGDETYNALKSGLLADYCR
jgi:4-methyl-5(b-hydroxyethyl)-thiazole monophosphate biosynthesis